MEGARIFSGDVLVVDRAVDPESGHIVVAAINGELVTNSAMYIKGAELLHLGVGYSTELKLKESSLFGDAFSNMPGKFFGGVTLNYYQLELSKQVIALNSIDEDEELSDIIDDNYEANQESTGNVGLDLGLIWQGDNFSAGFAWRNINEPEFDYGSVGIDSQIRVH